MVMSGNKQKLYEDKYCKLTKGKLVIKTYFFPFGGDKTIDVSGIKNVFYKNQQLPDDCFQAKDWGMTLSPIWWACDIGRGLHGRNSPHYNVVIDCGSRIMKGFSVKNIGDFLYHMNQLLDPSIFHSNEIPTFGRTSTLAR